MDSFLTQNLRNETILLNSLAKTTDITEFCRCKIEAEKEDVIAFHSFQKKGSVWNVN